MLIERQSISEYIVNRDDLEILLDRAKLLKSNIIVHSKAKHKFFGFSQDFQDANVLKVLSPNDSFEISHLPASFPNIACYAKDINAIINTSKSIESQCIEEGKKYTGNDIFIEATNYLGKNDIALNIKCGSELKPCFDYFKLEKKYEKIVNKEIPQSELIFHYEDIKNTIGVFNKALSAKADEGIKRFAYDDFVYFIPPTFIKSVKSDIIDLNVYKLFSGDNDTALLEFIIKRKKVGEIKVIYRTHIL